MSPAAGSAIRTPFTPASLKARAYATRNSVHFSSRAWTRSGSRLVADISSPMSISLQASENGPMIPPSMGRSLIRPAANRAALRYSQVRPAPTGAPRALGHWPGR